MRPSRFFPSTPTRWMWNRVYLSAFVLVSGMHLVGGILGRAVATDLLEITSDNYAQIVPKGKEVDAIHGDWVLRNDKVVCVIANPKAGRNANMTVRAVGGMLIDFTTRAGGSDQLSCFYPGGGRFRFEDAESFEWVVNESTTVKVADAKRAATREITLRIVGKAVANNQTQATIEYTLRDGQDWLDYRVEIANGAEAAQKIMIEDVMRCDGNLFQMTADDDRKMFYAADEYFGQCYSLTQGDAPIQRIGGRSIQLRPQTNPEREVASGERLQWSGKIHCSQGVPSALAWGTTQLTGLERYPLFLILKSPQGPVRHAQIEFLQDGNTLGKVRTNDEGIVRCSLLPGDYLARIKTPGQEVREEPIEITDVARAETLSLPEASRVRAEVTSGDGQPIAAKVQFVGIEGTTSPDFGPDSAVAAIKNVVYCAKGVFEQAIDPGRYRVIISHGPEFDADIQEVTITAGRLLRIESSLPRSVDTTGWVSTEYHSHSSPSGDNVSHQTGRVLNLLAEHIEFAPCTEHNRIDTYSDDLELLGVTSAMATCTGMELTGNPLPINHQNAFPMHQHVHEQDGGGPQTDSDPVKQIERLALWDNGSSKVVQTNHPNIPQILGDRDLNGKPDGGFRGMLGWMDVIEIHPLQTIFDVPPADIAAKDKNANRMFFWMRLLNLGYRIPGVVNTDAHYNFHGSGWLRNYLMSSTDDPGEISVDEMIHASEHGHLVMTTGPFLQTQLLLGDPVDPQRIHVGEDVDYGSKSGRLWIRVQCPNWFDVNRVQVFANGRALEELNFTRKSHAQWFSEDAVRFEAEVDLPPFSEDTHLIVATIGEGLKLGPVMGPERGELPPVAVTNPIFLDVDGGGFRGNGDDLGVPFMLPSLEDR